MLKKVNKSTLTKQREIAAGGEGKIYEHPSDKTKVVKIYHQARKPDFAKHLEKLSKLSSIFFVTPQDIYVDNKGDVIGFDMEYVNFNEYYLFNNLFNKGFCSSNGIDKSLKQNLLNELRICLEQVHKLDITIGDLNQYNLFFSKKKSILFVDVDSYQTSEQPHSGVLLDDIRDWSTTNINNSTDIWAYNILAFWITTYCHPFKWVVPGNKEPLEVRVRANKSILTPIKDIKIPALYEPPSDELKKQYLEIFSGRRYFVELKGTTIPMSPIIKQAISSSKLSIRELYSDVTHLYISSNYISIKTGQYWMLVEAKVKGITRLAITKECDELFPGNINKYVYIKGNTLYSEDGKTYTKSFNQPLFSYNNGYLGVIEYGSDIQWNYNIDNQLGGLDSTNTPIFAKSIIKRTSFLQNFGSKKYINIPTLNSYKLIEVPLGTQDALFFNNYLALEVKKSNKITYEIKDTFHESNFKSEEFDYFPYFTSMPGITTILVPDDQCINVFTNMQLISKFDCSICTKDSKLYWTTSGILLLENNILYLLNTK